MPSDADGATSGKQAALDVLSSQNLLGTAATYQTLVDSLPLCLLIKGIDGRRLFANQAYLDYRGCQLEEILGKHDRDLFPVDVAERFIADDQRVIESGNACQGFEETRGTDGSLRWIERFKCPLRDEHGEIQGIQLLFWDITAKREAELHRDRERQLLQTLLDNMPDSIYFKDKDSRFIRISGGMAAKFRIASAEAAIGLTDADIFTPEHAMMARNDEQEIMRTGKPLVSRVERETWPDRPDTWCSSTKLPLRDSNGSVIGTFGISRDVTDLKQTEEELAKARDAADSANRAKSDFLANMSHEIRTPMNAIIGMSELLSRTALNRDQRDYLEMVREAADSLLRLLNDILDFSKIEASKLELERIPFSLRECIGKTGQTLSLRAAEQGLELACRVAPDIPDRLIGDPGRLRQILMNLIGNAIKFTNEGEVFVDVVRDPEAATEIESQEQVICLRFSVRDTGIGIPAEKQASVLDAFTQADSSTTRRFGGTGLGLTISLQLTQLMGGKLWLESEVGVGTTFYFSIRACVAPSQCIEKTGALSNLCGLSVLIVDDNATNRRILQEMLLSWDLKPFLVASAHDAAIELVRAADASTPYGIAILDCMMPEIDGFGLAEWIRERFDKHHLKLIILSSAARVGDSERCERLGIARYLTKPVIESELLDAVLQVMLGGHGQGFVPEPSSNAHCRPLKILLAEDGLANKIVAKGLLEAGGHQVVVASDGRETVDCWEASDFDLILMDMHMPEMDGLQATQEIRRREAMRGLGRIPIVAITAAAMAEDARHCREAGMDGFLAKPLQPALLYETLAKFADLATNSFVEVVSQTNAAPPVTRIVNGVADRTRSAEKAIASGDILNLEEAMKRIPGGEKGVKRLRDVFNMECDQLLKAIRAAIDRGDCAEVHRASHTIKGSAKLFSATRVSTVAFEIEQRSKACDLDESRRLFPILESEIGELRAALELLLGP